MTRRASSELLLVISFALIVGSWFIGVSLELPFYYWWFDIILHTVGGLWASLCIAVVTRGAVVEYRTLPTRVLFFCAIVGGAVFIGVLWELMEFVIDRFIIGTGFTYLSGVIEDTMSDLVFDIIGATIGYSLVKKQRHHA